MIKLSENYEIKKDPYNWHLHSWSDGKDKGGNPKRQKRTTYHGTLRQVCDHIIEQEAGKCESLEEVKELLANATDILTAQVEGMVA